jgi:hypothetical protein
MAIYNESTIVKIASRKYISTLQYAFCSCAMLVWSYLMALEEVEMHFRVGNVVS